MPSGSSSGDFRCQLPIAEGDLRAGTQLLAGTNKALPHVISPVDEQQYLAGAATRYAVAQQTSRQSHGELLRIRQSPGRRYAGRSKKCRCSVAPVFLSSTSSREASRRWMGVWAISAGGRSK